jgi:hypothetical protein
MNNDDEVALQECCGFAVLPVRLLGDGAAAEVQHRFHDVMMKRLEASDVVPAALERDSGADARTVWMINVPVHYGKDALEELVASAGPLQRVVTCEYRDVRHTALRMALLTFRREQGAIECLKMRVARSFAAAVASEHAARDGPAVRAQQRYWALRPNEQVWQGELDAAVSEYDARVAAEAAEREAQATTLDADGFTIVRQTKSGRQKLGGANMKVASAQHKNRKRKTATVLNDFYAFQVGQRRENEMKELKRKFEEDRERLKRIRSNRVFNPVK